MSIKEYKIGQGFTIFLLFFGIALLDAIQSQHWIRVVFWVIIGIVFFLADNKRERIKDNDKN